MEENQPKVGKFSLNYGLILGLISVVFGIMLFTMDAHYSQDPANTVISIVIMVAVTIWGRSAISRLAITLMRVVIANAR